MADEDEDEETRRRRRRRPRDEDIVLSLTERERRLFDLLLETRDTRPELAGVSVRVAGGWVRDRVLRDVGGVADDEEENNDVDLALGGARGAVFAAAVRERLIARGGGDASRVGVVSANPARSKHLETATMEVFGIDVDFVNLRADEIYAEDGARGRVPDAVADGTPEQDAARRDATVNALFYDLTTGRVEDLTGRGLDDLLVHRVVRTPLDPRTTFADDPLRVLRAVRFAARLGFALDPDLAAAAASDATKRALTLKVSRERVGKELEGMLAGRGARPAEALRTLRRLGLDRTVFDWPPANDEEHASLWTESPTYLDALANEVLPAFVDKLEELSSSSSLYSPSLRLDVRMLHLASYLLPFFRLTTVDDKGREHPVVRAMLRDAVKFRNADADAIAAHAAHLDEVAALVDGRPDLDDDDDDVVAVYRGRVGAVLRRLKDTWIDGAALVAARAVAAGDADAVRRALRLVDAVARDLGLQGCWTWRPLLDGGTIRRRLRLPAGPLVGAYAEEHLRHVLSRHGLRGRRLDEGACGTFLDAAKRRREENGEDEAFLERLAREKRRGVKTKGNGGVEGPPRHRRGRRDDVSR